MPKSDQIVTTIGVSAAQVGLRSAVPLPIPAWNGSPAALEAVEKTYGISACDLAMQFETLGCRCEFSYVQRYLGAEPLSLLRFAGIAKENLIRGLDARFEGLGEEKLTLENDDCDARDRLYHIFYHGGKRLNIASERRRLHWLRDRFFADLAAPTKVYVAWRWQADNEELTIEAAMPLFKALRRHGPITMLVVSAGGTSAVEVVGDGLMFGTLPKLQPQTSQGAPDMLGWVEVLGNAWLLVGSCPAHATR